jgi:hypothetical protein
VRGLFAQRTDSSTDGGQPDHVCCETRIGFAQLGLCGSIGGELGDHVNGYTRAAKYRDAAHDFRIAHGEAAGAEV